MKNVVANAKLPVRSCRHPRDCHSNTRSSDKSSPHLSLPPHPHAALHSWERSFRVGNHSCLSARSRARAQVHNKHWNKRACMQGLVHPVWRPNTRGLGARRAPGSAVGRSDGWLPGKSVEKNQCNFLLPKKICSIVSTFRFAVSVVYICFTVKSLL